MKAKLLILITMFSFFISGCEKDNEQNNEEEQNTSNVNWVETKGKIKFPENFDDSNLGKLEIVAGIHSVEPSKIPGKTKSSEYEYTIPLVGGGTQLITLLNNDEPLMYGIVIVDNEIDIVLDAESTAIALLFLHPFLISYNAENANFVKEKLKQAPSFEDLVSEVESLLQFGSLSYYTPNIDPNSMKSYHFVLTEALAAMTENLNLNYSNLELEIIEENDEYIKAKIKNEHKRWVSVFAYRIDENGDKVAVDDIEIIDDLGLNLGPTNTFFTSSASFGFIDFIRSRINQDDPVIQESYDFIIKKNSADKIQIMCFGLGVRNRMGLGMPQFGTDEFIWGMNAAFMTFIFDYTLSAIQLSFGIQPQGYDGHRLLAGRPRDNPLVPLIENFGEKMLQDSDLQTFYSQFIFAGQLPDSENDKVKLTDFIGLILKCSYNFLTDDDNARHFYKILKEIHILKDFGIGSADDIKNLIKKVFRMGSLINIVETAETGTNIYLALEATFTSDWTTEFIVDLGKRTDNALVYDDFNDECLGIEHGGDYTTKDGRTVLEFGRENESRVVYDFDTQINKNSGTIEMIVFIENGYRYLDYELLENLEETLAFTTDIWGGDVTYPGSTWFRVNNDGKIHLKMATAKYGDEPHQILNAENTNFRFNQWHHIGFSYGDEGQYLFLDGKIVASNKENKQIMGAGGNHDRQLDKPTIGESVPGIWQKNRYEGGFNGYVDQFRASDKQQDWKLSL